MFGMGTGGSLRLLSPEILGFVGALSLGLFGSALLLLPSLSHLQNRTGSVIDLESRLRQSSRLLPLLSFCFTLAPLSVLASAPQLATRSSPRPISIINLHTLRHSQR